MKERLSLYNAFLLTFLLLIFGMLNAQVRIKEKVEIKPKEKNNLNTISSVNELKFLSGTIIDNSLSQNIQVMLPCKIMATGTLVGSGDYARLLYAYIAIGCCIDITNKTQTFESRCGQVLEIWLGSGYSTCGLSIENVSGSVENRKATLLISGFQHFPHPLVVPFTASITIDAVETDKSIPADLSLKISPNVINIDCEKEYGQATVRIYDKTGEIYTCGRKAILFSMTNTVEGINFAKYDYDIEQYINVGKSIEVMTNEGECSASIWIEGDKINQEEISIDISATGEGFTRTQTLQVRKIFPNYFEVIAEKNIIQTEEPVKIITIAKDCNGEDVELRDNINVTYYDWTEGCFIVGRDTFSTIVTVPYNIARNGGVKYYSRFNPKILNNTSTYIVVFRTEYPNKHGEESIEILPPCIELKATKERISLADTVTLSIVGQTATGERSYPNDQMFNVVIKEGAEYGRLRCVATGEEGMNLIGEQPFEFISVDSIEVDSVIVEMEVYPCYGGAASIRKTPEDTLVRANLNRVNSKTGDTNFIRSIEKLDFEFKGKINEKRKISIDEKHSAITAYEKANAVEKKQQALLKMRETALFASQELECNSTAQIVIKKEEPELVIIYPTNNLKERKEIANTPKMPGITTKARLKNYKNGTVNFNWNLTVKWENIENYGKKKRAITQTFTGTTTAIDSEVSEWKIDWQDKTRGGNDITLEVTASAGGKTYNKIIEHPFEILGMNPTIAMVKEELSIEEQVIVYMESKPKWKHFRSEFNLPSFGNPFGYGLMQLDKIDPTGRRATDEEIWNWKLNKATGKIVFAAKKTSATGFPGRIRKRTTLPENHKDYLRPGYRGTPDFNTAELLLKETFQRYNGGIYWFWKPYNLRDPNSKGEWIVVAKAQKGKTQPYGTEAWGLYKQVIDADKGIGTYPSGWN